MRREIKDGIAARHIEGNSQQTASSPFAPLIAKFAKSFLPSAKAFGQQETEALKTGGVNAQIPIINRAVDASRGAESSANQDTQQALARAGLADTSFGAQILGNQKMQGAQNTASIPSRSRGNSSRLCRERQIAALARRKVLRRRITILVPDSSTTSFLDQLQQGAQIVVQVPAGARPLVPKVKYSSGGYDANGGRTRNVTRRRLAIRKRLRQRKTPAEAAAGGGCAFRHAGCARQHSGFRGDARRSESPQEHGWS